MSQKRTPIKGQPDFTTLSDEKVKEYRDLAQQMIFAYKYCDEEKTRVMTDIWKQMSDEYTDRLCNAPFVEPVEESAPKTMHKIKTVKTLKRIKR